MTRLQLLVIGAPGKPQRRVVSLLEAQSGMKVVQQESCDEIGAYFSEHRIDATFVPLTENVERDIEAIRRNNPAMPLIFYAEAPDYQLTRRAFILSAIDVLDTTHLDEKTLSGAVRHALDPLRVHSADEVQHQMNCVRVIAQRGRHVENRLLEGNPPPFYMNGNRAVFLRANVLCERDTLLWQQDAAWEWVNEFGVNNAFIFNGSGSELHLGAIVDQDFVNAAAFRRMMETQLERCFERLRELGCIAAASWCSADYLSLTALHHLDRLAALVYYADDSLIISESAMQNNTALPEELYNRFYRAVTVQDRDGAVACVNEAVARLRRDMPAPSLARKKLNRFVMDFVSAVGAQHAGDILIDIHDSRINRHRDSIVCMIERYFDTADSAGEPSPLKELIERLERNPGLAISIDQAARETNFSRSHFCKLFREQTGQSFTEFLTAKRLDMACDLLRKTGMRIDEIAHIVGVSNAWYFKKLFLKEKGVSVEAWLEAQRTPAKVEGES